MALGNKKSDSSAAGDGHATTDAPWGSVNTAAQPEELINSLDQRLQQLQSTVAALVERTASGATVPGESGADPEVVAASRTLQMAKRTADSAVAEAKEEAEKLVADAREEHDSILRAARDAADQEYATQRDVMAREIASWEERKRELNEVFGDLDTKMTDYSGRLADAHQIVKTALESPVLVPEPEPDAVVEPDADAVDATGADESAPPVIEAGAPVPPESGETTFGNPPAPVFASATPGDAGSQAFYPWSGSSIPGQAAPEGGSEDAPQEDASPPVQRRGLFGH